MFRSLCIAALKAEQTRLSDELAALKALVQRIADELGLTSSVAQLTLTGTLAGLALGLGVAFNIDVIVPALENLLHANFLPKDIYLISRMPSDPQRSDILPVAVISLVLAFLATIYPSWRASRVNPAEALRYE